MAARYERYVTWGAGREVYLVDGAKRIMFAWKHPLSQRKYAIDIDQYPDGTVKCRPAWFGAYVKRYCPPVFGVAEVFEMLYRIEDLQWQRDEHGRLPKAP